MKLSVNGTKAVALIGCVFAAITAFASEKEKYDQSNTIKSLMDRVSKLEKES